MKPEHLFFVLYREENGFVARCLANDVTSDGDTEDEAIANLAEALALYFEIDQAALNLTAVEPCKLGRFELAEEVGNSV